MPLYPRKIKTLAKSGDTKLTKDVTLTGGTNVTLTQSGQDISIASSAGGANHTLDSADHTDVAVITEAKGQIVAYDSVAANWDALTVGADDEVLTADSAQDIGVKWAAAGGGNHTLDSASHTDVNALTEAKGDLLVWDSTNGRWEKIAIGADTEVLIADSAIADIGIKWGAAGGAAHAFDSATHTDVTAITEAQGMVLYWDGSNWNALATGTSGQFLKTQGAGANPVWDDAPAATGVQRERLWWVDGYAG